MSKSFKDSCGPARLFLKTLIAEGKGGGMLAAWGSHGLGSERDSVGLQVLEATGGGVGKFRQNRVHMFPGCFL